jgi:hypothetical protein
VSAPDGLSGNKVKSAGKLLRRHRNFDGTDLFTAADIADALETLQAFRARFSKTQVLARVRIGAEGMARHTAAGVQATQRLKRADRIVGKLARFPDMQLTTMDDIAGCRRVVQSLDEQRVMGTTLRTTPPRDSSTNCSATVASSPRTVVASSLAGSPRAIKRSSPAAS